MKEAKVLAELGVDIIIGQGSEAGGHRGTFIGKRTRCYDWYFCVNTSVSRGYSAYPNCRSRWCNERTRACCGIGTRSRRCSNGISLLTSEESITHDVYKEAVLHSTDTSTTVTRAFSGKYARGIRNEFIERHEGKEEGLPVYPVQNVLTSKIRQEAAKQNKEEYMSLWAGQAASLARIESAQHVVERVMKEAANAIEQLQNIYKRPLE